MISMWKSHVLHRKIYELLTYIKHLTFGLSSIQNTKKAWFTMEVRRQRSTSRPRPVSRPTTPLRSSSRASIRDAHGASSGGSRPGINSLEPQFAELADSMADLEENFAHLQLMHESLSRFNESFASFLYGLNMNAFCVDFPEVCWDYTYIWAFPCHCISNW